MKYEKGKLTGKPARILLLFAILALLTPLALHTEGATRAQTGTSTVLDPPALTATSTGANEVELSWNADPDAARYLLWVWWAGLTEWQRLDDGNLTGASYPHTGLTSGTKYFYLIRAVDADGRESDSRQIEFLFSPTVSGTQTPTPTPTLSSAHTPTPTPTATPTEFPLPAPVLTAKAGPGQVTLTWEAVSNAHSYFLIYYDWAISDWRQIGGVLTGTSYTHRGATVGKTHYYLIHAVGANGAQSGWSEHGIAIVTEPSVNPDAAADRAALVALYNATDGANWPFRENWLSDMPIATWYGVTTDSSGRITRLVIEGNGLTGPVPDLSALTNLTYLTLGSNQLTGPFPDLNALTNLTYLSLSDNLLSGPIPDLSALVNLTDLYINDNQLTGNIPNLGALSNLKNLELGSNQLTGAFPDLGALTNLRALSLVSNRLSGPIPDLSRLTNLTALYLTSNQLSGRIPDLSRLTNLTRLYLGSNQLSGPIPVLNALTNLRTLSLPHNRLIGPVPDLSALTKLSTLQLEGNNLCLQAGTGLSGANEFVAPQLQSLNLPPCTDVTPTMTVTPTTTPTPTISPTPTPTPASTVSALPAPALTAKAEPGQITLTWEEVANADSYYLIYYDWANSDWRRIGGVLTGASYTHRGLTAGTIYYYLINAVGANGSVSAWSNYAKAIPSDTTTPTPTPTPTPTATAADISETTPAEERAALVALYNATDGANWTNNANWWTDEPVSSWHGVTTNSTGHVTMLSLTNNGLRGPLPDLSALTNLTHLYISISQLTGPVPDLSSLTNLRVLYLYHNQLTGQIPDLSALTNLETLNLDSNNLTGPIPDLSALTNLTSLNLSQNPLTGPFPDISALTNLTRLGLAANQLTGPFPDLSAFTNLRSLYLYNNQFTGPFPDLTTLTNLTVLYLGGNQLNGQIPDLSYLSDLRELDISYNQFTGHVPDLSALTKLTTLYIAGNDLCLQAGTSLSHPNSSVTAQLRSLNPPSCTTGGTEQRAALVAFFNATDGANWKNNDNWLSNEPISTWYGVFTNNYGHVTRLSLGHNELSGTLPDLSDLTNLSNVFLASNQLSGEIPDLSALTRLSTLNLDSNQLTGPVPEVSALTNLTSLALSHNQLTGPFPDLSNLTNLTRLSISNNLLTGQFPDLSTLTRLRGLYIGGNQLSGPFPDLSALTGLRVLSLRSSQLQGQISDLSALTYLVEMDLSDNQLTGPFPDLSALSFLTQLFLHSNQLTGPFPDLSALTNLQHLDLRSNQLSGHLTDLSALTKLKSLDLGSNQLTGEIPDLSALTSLTRLEINNNQLTGQLPDLSLLTKLARLDLSHNQLTGPILDLSFFTDLALLHLDHNMLAGPVPDLGALTNLTSLDLADNLLCLPAGFSFSGLHTSVAAHLNRLSLQTCTSTETMVAPGMPQNLTATVGVGQVTLTWDAVANAAGYELRVWDSLDRQWGAIGGVLTGTTTYTHTVLTDGRNYHFQVRARNANDVVGAWSDRVYAAVVTPRFPPPPLSLGLDLFYQKYLDVGGMTVIAPTEVSDNKLVQVRDVITSTLSERSDLLDALAADHARIGIYPDNQAAGGITQLPELWFLTSLPLGYVHRGGNLHVAGVPDEDPHCGTLVHELAHMVHYMIDEQTGGADFNSRLQAAYQAALNAGLWDGLYARRNDREYWAEAVRFWFWETLPPSLATSYSKLADYDPTVAELVEEVFGEATLVSYCKP